jgi:lysozyme
MMNFLKFLFGRTTAPAPAPRLPPIVRRSAGYAVIAATLAIPFEGLYTHAYHDTLAKGLPTVCYGMTSYDRPVKMGDVYTPEQCKVFLEEDLVKYHDQIFPCVHVKLSQHEWAALTDAAYNVGSSAICKSTAVRRFNAGDHHGGCEALAAFNRAGGQMVKGLVRRRSAEIEVCETRDT